MAEGIFAKMIAENGHEAFFGVESAGTVCYQKGAAPDHRAVDTAFAHGVDIADQEARCIRDLELERYARIFTMDRENYHDTLLCSRSEQALLPVSMVTDYLSDRTATGIEDPYYGTTDDFFKVFRQLEEALSNIYKELLFSSAVNGGAV